MKKVLALLLTICCIVPMLTACGPKTSSVVVYSSMEDYRNTELSRQLKEKFPDISVTVQYLSTGNSTAKVKAEGTNTEASIVLGLETASFFSILDNFASLEDYPKDQYLPEMVSKDPRCVIWEKFDGAFIVNTNVLKEKGLAEPKSYEDLLKPEYKGLIVMSNPKTSSTGYMFLNSWVNTMGEDGAFAYADKLQANIKEFSESGSGPVKKLVQGEAAIGLGMVFQAVEQLNAGAPLKVIVPQEGCAYNTTSLGIIKGKQTDENVKKVFEFIYNDFMKYDKENYAPGKVLQDQQTKLQNYPTSIQYSDMSTISDMEMKQSLISKWKY